MVRREESARTSVRFFGLFLTRQAGAQILQLIDHVCQKLVMSDEALWAVERPSFNTRAAHQQLPFYVLAFAAPFHMSNPTPGGADWGISPQPVPSRLTCPNPPHFGVSFPSMAKKHMPAHPPTPTVTEQQLLAFLVSDARFPAEGYRSGMFALATSLGYADTLLSSVRLRGYLDALVADAHAGGLHMKLMDCAHPKSLADVMVSVRVQGLIGGFVGAAKVDHSLPTLLSLAGQHGFLLAMIADARREGNLADILAAANVADCFADLISAAEPLEDLLKDAAQIGPYLPMLFDAARTSGLLPKVLAASYATGLTGDLLAWAKDRDCLFDLSGEDNRGIGELMAAAQPVGYLPDLLSANPSENIHEAHIYGYHDALADFERDLDSIPVLDHPYRTILSDVEIDLEARRDPFAFGSVADRLITMAGNVGDALRERYGTTGAARLIHRKSRPDAPGLRCDESTPLDQIVAYLRERAAEEPSVSEEMPSAAVA